MRRVGYQILAVAGFALMISWLVTMTAEVSASPTSQTATPSLCPDAIAITGTGNRIVQAGTVSVKIDGAQGTRITVTAPGGARQEHVLPVEFKDPAPGEWKFEGTFIVQIVVPCPTPTSVPPTATNTPEPTATQTPVVPTPTNTPTATPPPVVILVPPAIATAIGKAIAEDPDALNRMLNPPTPVTGSVTPTPTPCACEGTIIDGGNGGGFLPWGGIGILIGVAPFVVFGAYRLIRDRIGSGEVGTKEGALRGSFVVALVSPTGTQARPDLRFDGKSATAYVNKDGTAILPGKPPSADQALLTFQAAPGNRITVTAAPGTSVRRKGLPMVGTPTLQDRDAIEAVLDPQKTLRLTYNAQLFS